MSTLKKLLAILVCLVVVCGCLGSCDVIEGLGGSKREADRYEASVRIVFATNDDKMKAAVDAMSSSAVIKADGDSIFVETTAESDDTVVSESFTAVDGYLYHYLSLQSGIYSAERREVAAFTDTDSYFLLSEIGAGADIDITDFKSCDASELNGKTTYDCQDITSEAREGLYATLSEDFSALGATVDIKDVYFILETEGDLEMKSTLSCNFIITMNGESYEITMRTYTEYDYDKEIEITVPSDADAYKEVSYKEIIG